MSVTAIYYVCIIQYTIIYYNVQVTTWHLLLYMAFSFDVTSSIVLYTYQDCRCFFVLFRHLYSGFRQWKAHLNPCRGLSTRVRHGIPRTEAQSHCQYLRANTGRGRDYYKHDTRGVPKVFRLTDNLKAVLAVNGFAADGSMFVKKVWQHLECYQHTHHDWHAKDMPIHTIARLIQTMLYVLRDYWQSGTLFLPILRLQYFRENLLGGPLGDGLEIFIVTVLAKGSNSLQGLQQSYGRIQEVTTYANSERMFVIRRDLKKDQWWPGGGFLC